MILPSDPSLLERVTQISIAIIAISLSALTIVAIPVAFQSRRTYRKIHQLVDRVYDDIAPIVRHAHQISDNVDFVTTSIRADVQKVNDTIDGANERVQHALSLTEQRMTEFNALLAVVQEEAEHVFLSAASTVRGVQHGAAAFRDRSGMDLASDELDAADPADDDDIEIQEEDDGYHGNPESAAQALPTVPRVRPRHRNQRRA